jgi:threonine aldolase
MNMFSRRGFLKVGATSAAIGLEASFWNPTFAQAATDDLPSNAVHFFFDGLMITPSEYSQLLLKLSKTPGIEADSYLSGGSVQRMEKFFAHTLGKESAVYLPTGTLANHLALRVLSGEKSRALVQSESHIYCDSVDCVQTLSHINLVPLAEGRATFTLQEVQAAVERAANGPYPLQIGAISIECPVRRMHGKVFDYEEMKKIAEYARHAGIKLHLDGARLFIASAYTGISPQEYAALFDTVYISLYKYFNAASGAVLAGPKPVVERIAHGRKLFGGGMLHGWPYCAVASHFADGFLDRFKNTVATANELFGELGQHPGFRVEPYPHGTNIYRLHVPVTDIGRYAQNLRKSGILISTPRKGPVPLTINESLNRRPGKELAKAFIEASAAG